MATYTYTKNNGEVIEVVGKVVDNRKHLSAETHVTLELETPRNGKPYITCRKGQLVLKSNI